MEIGWASCDSLRLQRLRESIMPLPEPRTDTNMVPPLAPLGLARNLGSFPVLHTTTAASGCQVARQVHARCRLMLVQTSPSGCFNLVSRCLVNHLHLSQLRLGLSRALDPLLDHRRSLVLALALALLRGLFDYEDNKGGARSSHRCNHNVEPVQTKNAKSAATQLVVSVMLVSCSPPRRVSVWYAFAACEVRVHLCGCEDCQG